MSEGQANDSILLSLIRETLETMVTENGEEETEESRRYPLLDKPGLAYLHKRLLEEVILHDLSCCSACMRQVLKCGDKRMRAGPEIVTRVSGGRGKP